MCSSCLAFICILAALPAPPSFFFEEAYFSLYPINRIKCPITNPKRDIRFELFTPNNPNTSQILLLENDKSIEKSNLNFLNPTVIHFHGFLESALYGSADMIRRVYVKRGDYNIIIVNAQVLLAGPWYYTAAKNTKVIGKYTAQFIDYLITKGLNLRTVHLIGHSLGGHSAGICGSSIESGRIPRITGLDPALPLFKSISTSLRLDPSDAEFVDVIHTDGGQYGFKDPIGHVDFYPNGGSKTQPGCTFQDIIITRKSSTPIFELVFCSHWRSFIFYAESVLNPATFLSVRANSWEQFQLGYYEEFGTSYMGFGVSKNASGKFYLRTYAEAPYSL